MAPPAGPPLSFSAMPHTFRIYTLIILSLWLGMSACTEGNGPEQEVCQFDLSAMQQALGTDIIIPAWSEMLLRTKLLEEAAETFAQVPESNNLLALQLAYQETHLAYQSVSAFNFGPAMDQGFHYRERVNTFPTSEAGIEQAIDDQLFDVENSFKSVVGLPAIAYLIYGSPGSSMEEVLEGFADQDRLTYLELLSGHLRTLTQAVQEAWIPEGGDYLTGFAASTGSGEGSALSLLVNELNFDFETLKNFKLKLPLGKLNGGVIQPQKAEGYYNGSSLGLAKAHAQALYRMYQGGSSPQLLSLDGYLRCLKAGEDMDGTLLANAIQEQWEQIFASTVLLNDPLFQRLEDDKESVDAVHLEMQKMVPLLKREMTAALGVRISYIDNDGD